ncbi:HCLS1-associated protein X-1-like [Littorina saxatilis]|uniref:HCLS1-associated protein X-1-like n=1 Tax=Littorina saxatilis TaxID=31220 RepID=UPI0038B65FA6
MDPNEIFKRFFGGPFPGFGEGGVGPSPGQGDGWSDGSHHGADMFDDMQRQMQQQMEEMDKQMREVFRIFRIPQEPSDQGIPALSDGREERVSKSKSNPRDHMLKDDKATPPSSQQTEPPGFSSPGPNFGILSDWIDQFTKLPKWNRVHPEDRIDRDLDGKSPSSAEIADLFKQKKEEPSRELMPAHPFSFRSNSVRIQTVIGADGVVEERRTVRDSSGREETTVTRRVGDSSHTVTTIKDSQGREEKHETYNNIDKEKLTQFDQQWTGKNILTEPDCPVKTSPRKRGILSDENRGIFRKFFGF